MEHLVASRIVTREAVLAAILLVKHQMNVSASMQKKMLCLKLGVTVLGTVQCYIATRAWLIATPLDVWFHSRS